MKYSEDNCKHKRKSITTHGRKSHGYHFCVVCGKRLSKRDFQKRGFKKKEVGRKK